MHTIVNYAPAGGSPVTQQVAPANDLNGSAAALNASIKALTDAIAAAQAVLATLVPYTGATENVNLGSHSLIVNNLSSSGESSLDDGAIITSGGGAVTIDSDSSSVALTATAASYHAYIGCGEAEEGPAACGGLFTDGTNTARLAGGEGGSFTDGSGNSVDLCNNSSALQVSGQTSLDGGLITTDGSGNLLVSGTGSGDYPGNAAFVVANGPTGLDNGFINTDGYGDLLVDGAITSDHGPFSTDYGLITTDGSGNLTIDGNISIGDGAITTDSFGNISACGGIIVLNGTDLTVGATSSASLIVTGQTKLDGSKITTDGGGNMIAVSVTGAVMTSNSTGTAGFNTSGYSETIYDSSSSTVASLTLTLPSTTTPGQICRYVTKAIVTTDSVTGTVSIGAAVTTLAANASVAWQAVNTSGTFIRIQ